jgi:hypothetical protein
VGVPSLILVDNGDSLALAQEARARMSYLDFVDEAILFNVSSIIDRDLAEQARRCGCVYCGGTLRYARYMRKPRGEQIEIPESSRVRQGMCCTRCRKRTLPESILFFGRRVYWGSIFVLATAAAQNKKISLESICRRFGVTRRTVKRWIGYFEEFFPKSTQWQRARGRVCATVGNGGLPRDLLDWIFGIHGQTMKALMTCLGLISTEKILNIQGSIDRAQKMRVPM